MFDARVGKQHKLARHCSLGNERERKSSKRKKERKQLKGCKRGGNESMRHRAEEIIGQRVHTCAGKQCHDPVWSSRRLVSGIEVG